MSQLLETPPEKVQELPGSLFGQPQPGDGSGPEPVLKAVKSQKELFLTLKGTWTGDNLREVLPRAFLAPERSQTLHLDLSKTKELKISALDAIFEVLRANTHKFQNILITGLTTDEFRHVCRQGIEHLLGINWCGDFSVDKILLSRC
jgi:hypothetical protein